MSSNHILTKGFCVAATLWIMLATNVSCKKSQLDTKAITIVGSAADTQKLFIKRAVALYQEKTGRALNIISLSNEDYDDDLIRAMKVNDVDIIIHAVDSALMALDPTETFVDLTNQWWVRTLTQQARVFASDDNARLIGLPFWENATAGCYYNKKIFDRFGLKAATTQVEFDTLCKTLHDVGITPIAWTLDAEYTPLQYALDAIFYDDPALLRSLNNRTLSYADIPKVCDVLTWVYNAHKNGYLGHTFIINRYADLPHIIGSGDAAMIFTSDAWFDTDFVSAASSKKLTYSKDDFALMPVFLDETDTGTFQTGNLKLMLITTSSTKVALAKDFLAFCATPENFDNAFKNIATGKVFQEQSTIRTSPAVFAVRSSINHNSRPSTVEQYINGYTNAGIAKAVRAMFTTKATPDEALSIMDSARIESFITPKK